MPPSGCRAVGWRCSGALQASVLLAALTASGAAGSIGSGAKGKNIKKAHVKTFEDFAAKMRGVMTGDFVPAAESAGTSTALEFTKAALQRHAQKGGAAAPKTPKLKELGLRRLDKLAPRGPDKHGSAAQEGRSLQMDEVPSAKCRVQTPWYEIRGLGWWLNMSDAKGNGWGSTAMAIKSCSGVILYEGLTLGMGDVNIQYPYFCLDEEFTLEVSGGEDAWEVGWKLTSAWGPLIELGGAAPYYYSSCSGAPMRVDALHGEYGALMVKMENADTTYGTVCADSAFGIAEVACRELGKLPGGARMVERAMTLQQARTITCSGEESAISECRQGDAQILCDKMVEVQCFSKATVAFYNTLPEAGGVCFYWAAQGGSMDDKISGATYTVGPIPWKQVVHVDAIRGKQFLAYTTTESGECPPAPALIHTVEFYPSDYLTTNIFGLGPSKAGGVAMRRLDGRGDSWLRQGHGLETTNGGIGGSGSAMDEEVVPQQEDLNLHPTLGPAWNELHGSQDDQRRLGYTREAEIHYERLPLWQFSNSAALSFRHFGIGLGDCKVYEGTSSDPTNYLGTIGVGDALWAEIHDDQVDLLGPDTAITFACGEKYARMEQPLGTGWGGFLPAGSQTEWGWKSSTVACYDDDIALEKAGQQAGFTGLGKCTAELCSDEALGPVARFLCGQTCGTCVQPEVVSCVNQDSRLVTWTGSFLNASLNGCEDPFIVEGNLCFGGGVPSLLTYTINELCPVTCMTCGISKTCEARADPKCEWEGAACGTGTCRAVEGQDELVCSNCPDKVLEEMLRSDTSTQVICGDADFCTSVDGSACDELQILLSCPKVCGLCGTANGCDNRNAIVADNQQALLLAMPSWDADSLVCEDLTPADCEVTNDDGAYIWKLLCPEQCVIECAVASPDSMLFTWTGDLRKWLCPLSSAVFQLIGDRDQVEYPLQTFIVAGSETCQPTNPDVTATVTATPESTNVLLDLSFTTANLSTISMETLSGSLAGLSGNGEQDIKVESFTAIISVGYSFEESVEQDQVRDIVATAAAVPASKVSVTRDQRRLTAAAQAGRRLASNEWLVAIETDDLELAKACMKMVTDTATLQEAIAQHAPGAANPEITHSPSAELVIQASFSSSDGSMQDPDASALEEHFEAALGIDIETLAVGAKGDGMEPADPPSNEDPLPTEEEGIEEANRAIGAFGGALGGCAVLALAAAAAATAMS